MTTKKYKSRDIASHLRHFRVECRAGQRKHPDFLREYFKAGCAGSFGDDEDVAVLLGADMDRDIEGAEHHGCFQPGHNPYRQKKLLNLTLRKAVVSGNRIKLALRGRPPELLAMEPERVMAQSEEHSAPSDWYSPVRWRSEPPSGTFLTTS